MTNRTLLRAAYPLFERALDIEPADRDSWLDRECAGRSELRALVDSLIESVDTPHDLLDAGAQAFALLTDAPERDEAGPQPNRIGPYAIIREAGRGGMATVYLAERQAGDVVHRVAVKLVKRGVDTDEVVRRFAHERRVLASLEHPNVARFHDAGTSEDGRPYLVMEFIEGLPVTRWADEHRLGIGARLELFDTICTAVQFAHQRLVIHRDIKPSNILVTDRGDVKLLDFGIAKLLSNEPDTDSPLTRTGMRVLTPEYAAPEQVRGEPITTATDVYAGRVGKPEQDRAALPQEEVPHGVSREGRPDLSRLPVLKGAGHSRARTGAPSHTSGGSRPCCRTRGSAHRPARVSWCG
jgi:serine/threonine-protein kinase